MNDASAVNDSFRALVLKRLATLVPVAGLARRDDRGLCGMVPRVESGLVRLGFRRGSVIYPGLHECGRAATCPRCAREPLRDRRAKIEALLATNHARGGDSVMVSLSVGFPATAGLHERWGYLRDMFTMLSIKTRRTREKMGKIGQIKIVHLLHGKDGWHAHLHVVLLLNKRITQRDADALADKETVIWADLAQSPERTCTAYPMAQRYTLIGRTPKDFQRVAKYLTKGLEEIEWGDELEPGDDFNCTLDHHRNRSPWQLMNDVAFNRHILALAPLSEWANVMASSDFQAHHVPNKLKDTAARVHTSARILGTDRTAA